MLRSVAVTVIALGGLTQSVASPEERAEGFVPLFDGTSLTGWHVVRLGTPTGSWSVRDGVLSNDRDRHIGFQGHLNRAPVEFRNVRIKVLDHAHPDPHE